MTQAYSTLRVAPGDDGVLEVAERYGWINRAVPDADLDGSWPGSPGASRRSPPMLRCNSSGTGSPLPQWPMRALAFQAVRPWQASGPLERRWR